MSVRVRFAPSPTGNLHIGGLRVALFNWLFARKNNGLFLIRIEDTDFERSTPEYTQAILQSFSWVHIASDEPIVIQSERIPEHIKKAQELVAQKKAYYCYCSQQELADRLGANASTGSAYTRYDGLCRNLESTDTDKPYVIRFKIPANRGSISFVDAIRGLISFEADTLDDFIIVRSGLVPTYNFVVVLDDSFMNITHVIRGEEHISNTPKQILLYEAFGYALPIFAHAPLILGTDGSKLSKRDAATSVLDYKRNGFLPEALINYLVRLGWASGDQELFTVQEMIDQFSLEGIGKKGSIFDVKKLEWVNSVYIKQKSAEQLLTYIQEHTNPDFKQELSCWSQEQILAALELYKSRVKNIKELEQELISLSTLPELYNPEDCQKWITPESKASLEEARTCLEELVAWDNTTVTAALKELCQKLNIALPKLAQPLRIALLGKTTSPGVFEIITLLGKKEVSTRIFTFLK